MSSSPTAYKKTCDVKPLMVVISLVFCLVLGLSENGFAADISSVRNGSWSSPATWEDGAVPGPDDSAIIENTVVYDLPTSRISGMTIVKGGKLIFSPDQSGTFETDENIVIYGELEMKPRSPSVIHQLRFVDVDETQFVGGGMAVLDTDVGLWIVDDGRLDAVGAAKTAWTHLTAGAKGGDSDIAVSEAEGWQIGDKIVIVPTEHPDAGDRAWNGFEERTISQIEGDAVRLDRPLSHDHPEVQNPFNDDVYTAEVLNVTRNVKIAGVGDHTPSFQPDQNGRAHVIFLATTQPQTVKYVELNHLGPRRTNGEYTEGVKGRYPLHFHHAGDGARGSTIEGVVAQRSGNRGFVPHASHGITLRSTIAYDVFESPYWWDQPDRESGIADYLNVNNTDDLLIDHAVAALVKVDPPFRGYRLSGFVLTRGKDHSLTIRDSVAVGVKGNVDASGFKWPEHGQAIWNFNGGNIAHNNEADGIFVWQNNSGRHEIRDFIAYNNGNVGIDHGAYGNVFQYSDVFLFDNDEGGFISHAAAIGETFRTDGYSHAIERLKSTGMFVIRKHRVDYAVPTLVKDSIIGKVEVNDQGNGIPSLYDFVNVTKPDGSSIEPADFDLVAVMPKSVFRVQRMDRTAFKITGAGEVSEIDAFYHETKPQESQKRTN